MSVPQLKKEIAVTTSQTPNRFMAAVVTKKVKFLGLDLEINKLSVQQTVDMRETAKAVASAEDELGNFKLICEIVRMGAKELGDLTDEELATLSLDDLVKLSDEIMMFSGLSAKAAEKK